MTSPIVRSFLERSEKSPLGLFGLDAPSGGDRASLKRDLTDGKRILLRRPSVYEIRAIDKKAREVEVVASTSGVKRDGNAIFHSEKAWDFRNFEKNPAMLWSHDYGSAFSPPGLPLGYWKTWGVEKTKAGNALVMRGWFEEDEFPEKVWRRILSGTIRAVSIGWNPLEFEELKDEKGRQVGWNFTLNELYECSWVVIGADPDAGVRGMYADLSEEELDVIANGRRAHELSRGVAYMLDHRDAPEEFVRSIVNLPKELEMETNDNKDAATTVTADSPEQRGGSTLDLGVAFRTLATMLEKRGPLSDALDTDYDKLKATHYGMDEPVSQLYWMINSLYYNESATDSPDDPRAYASRCIKRCRGMIGTMLEALDSLESTLGGSTESPSDMETAGSTPAEGRVGKKMSSKRLQTLKKCREGIDEVIKECEGEECDDKEMASGTPEVAREVTPEVTDPNDALRDLTDKLVRSVQPRAESKYAAAMLGDLASKLAEVVS